MDTPSTVALLDLQIAALFRHDANGRIVCSNEPEPNCRAPRFFFGRSAGGNRWRFRDDLPDDVVQQLEAPAVTEPVTTDLTRPVQLMDAARAVLAAHATSEGEDGGPAFYFPRAIAHPSNVLMIDPTNLDLLLEMEPDIPRFERNIDVMGPCAVVVEDGVAVSMCFSARFTDHVAEAGLDTLPRARRQGYALAVTAAWANAVRAMDRVPLYSTSWDNTASRAVARRLGLTQYAEDISFG